MERLRFAGNAMLPAKVSTMPTILLMMTTVAHIQQWPWLQIFRRG